MEKLISELLTELERYVPQELCNNTDATVRKPIRKVNNFLTLLRSDIMSDANQLSFIPDEKSWIRNLRAHKNFTLVAWGKLFEKGSMNRQVSTCCYCVQIMIENKCQQYDAVMNEQSNWSRKQGIAKWCSTS